MTMTKRVNVRANIAIRNINPPIYGTCNNIIMTTGDILKCLCRRAHVEEILPDGHTVKLNMSNYFTDNGAGLSASTAAVEKENITEPTVTPATDETTDITDTVEDSCAEISSAENMEINEIDTVEDVAPIDEDVVEETPIEEEHHEDENVEVEAVEDVADIATDSEDTVDVTAETEEVHADEEKTTAKKSSRKKKSNK